ncbi:Ig-like domain-containing protein, partial [Roseimaritima sediminicola]|uniref:Ig-like domain-containing protein n=1 Tax=Roseimaritima sediminicola TaxID=2662066 RepID=UPI00192A5B7F
MWFRNTTRQRTANRRQLRRRQLSQEILGRPRGEVLEDRRLLAFDAWMPIAGRPVDTSNDVATQRAEVSIDINPVDPNNIVIFGHGPGGSMDSNFSIDGGLTWTNVQINNTNNAEGVNNATNRFDPTVAFDDYGNVYVAYATDSPAGRELYVAKSTDGGASYTQAALVDSEPAGGNLDKWIIETGPDPVDPSQQNVYLAYLTLNDNLLHLAASYDGGLSFPTTTVFNDDGAADAASFATPAVGPDGELYVIWDDFSNNPNSSEIKYDVSLDGGVTFLRDNGAANATNERMFIPATASFHTTAVTEGNDNGFAGRPNPGRRYAISAQVERGILTVPSIAVDQSQGPFRGRVYASYTVATNAGSTDDTDVVVTYSDDLGETWSPPVVVHAASESSQFLPWLDVDPWTGAVGVVFYDTRQDSDDEQTLTYLATSVDGGDTWRETQVAQATSDQTAAGGGNANADYLEYIGVAALNDRFHMVWTDNSDFDNSGTENDYFYAQAHLIGPDEHEPNDAASQATILGSLDNVTVSDQTIKDPLDLDWFKYTANQTGKLLVNAFSETHYGDVDFGIFDDVGNVIAGRADFTNDTDLAIPDSGPLVTSTQFVSGYSDLIGDVDVTLNVDHTFTGDLEIFLVSPSGTIVELTTDNNGGDNFISTTFDDEAGVDVVDGHNPYAGRFRPEGNLSDFDGEDPNGTWTLRVLDDFAFDTGTLRSWTLSISTNDVSTETAGLEAAMAAIPVVSQEEYFIRVVSANGQASVYDLEIENFAAPVPSAVVLDAASDTGMMNNDQVTADDTPSLLIQADLQDFADMGIDVLNAAVAAAAVTPGVAVEVMLANAATGATTTGYASPVGSSTTLFAFTPQAPLADGTYLVSAASVVFDGYTPPQDGRSPLSSPLTLTIDTQAPTALIDFDLLDSSDSGMSMDDYVTHIRQVAFDGEVEAGAKVRIYAAKIIGGVEQAAELVGQGIAGNYPPSLNRPDNGVFEITVEPLVDSIYNITVELEDAAGNVASFDPFINIIDIDTEQQFDLEIDTLAPNLPFLDLLESSDTGRHNDDNVTFDNTPTLSMTSEDRTANPADYDHLFADNFKFRIFDRLEGTTEILLYDSFADFGNFVSVQQLIHTTGILADGIHNLKLEVEDRAGNISHDFLLDVLIDTVAPPVTIDSIDQAATDTGVTGAPATFNDNITSDTSTGFVGTAEANAIVRLYVDAVDDGLIGNPAEFSLTVALPFDGDDALAWGQWNTAYRRDLNNPNAPDAFPHDGFREVIVEAEDLAGNINMVTDENADGDQQLEIFIDTHGPQVTDVFITDAPAYDLFDLKPTQGPTPVVQSLTVSVQDLPDRVAAFLYEALQSDVPGNPTENPANYRVVGDHNGHAEIASVTFLPDPLLPGEPATGNLRIDFARPLLDDRYTLTISDAVVDPAGNALDGDSNAGVPTVLPTFPSGDGQ